MLFGNLMWAARILHEPLYRYPRWMAWVSQRARQLHANPLLWDKPCHIWPTALSDLKALTTRVCDNRVYDLHQQEVTTEVFTDASDKGYGVVIPDTEEGGGQTYAAWWTISMRKHTISGAGTGSRRACFGTPAKDRKRKNPTLPFVHGQHQRRRLAHTTTRPQLLRERTASGPLRWK